MGANAVMPHAERATTELSHLLQTILGRMIMWTPKNYSDMVALRPGTLAAL